MSAPAIHREPPSKHTLKLLVGPVIVLWTMTQIANVTWATLSESHPLLLITLSSINRYLVLVSDQLDAVSYYGVGTVRLLVSDPLFFLLGYWYGEKALAWMDSRAPNYGPMMRGAQRGFGRYGWLLVLVAPNNIICLLAGAAGMRIALFFSLNLVGTVGRLYVIRLFGDVFSSPIDSFRDTVSEYQWWVVGASFLLVAWSLRSEFRGGGEIDTLRHVGDLADDDTDAPD